MVYGAIALSVKSTALPESGKAVLLLLTFVS